MAWSLATVTIYPGDEGDAVSVEAKYAIQEVLDATAETISWYGAGSERRALRFVLLDDTTGLSTLKTAVATDANVNLTSDQGSQGNYRIMRLRAARIQDHAYTNPCYRCEAELIKAA